MTTEFLELRHLVEWNPMDPYPFRVYWVLPGKWRKYDNYPHLLLLTEMEDFIKDANIDGKENRQFFGQYKNWNQSERTGFSFAKEQDACMFWMRFNGAENK
jgi:hypothetical protein